MLSGGTTGCSPECRRRRYCGRTQREATSSDKSSQPAAHQTTPQRQEPAPRQAARPAGGKMQPVGKVETFLEAAKTWAGWTTAWLSSMSSFFFTFLLHLRECICAGFFSIAIIEYGPITHVRTWVPRNICRNLTIALPADNFNDSGRRVGSCTSGYSGSLAGPTTGKPTNQSPCTREV